MHKRTPASSSERQAAAPAVTMPVARGKKSDASTGSRGKAAISSWRDAFVFAGIACLLLVATTVVTGDRLEYASNDVTPRTAHLRAQVAPAVSYSSSRKSVPQSLMQRKRKMEPAPIERGHSEHEEESAFRMSASEAGSSAMGKSVLDELQSQEQITATTTTRMIIREGDIKGKVPGSALDATADRIESLVEDPEFGEGGYVSLRSVEEGGYYYSREVGRRGPPKAQRIVSLKLRIPSSYFQLATQKIRQIIEDASPNEEENPLFKGKITSLTTNGRDVTDEFVDATARADTLDASRKAMQVLLSRADTIKDVMDVQRELNDLTQQSESLRRRALELKGKSDLSALNVRLTEYMDSDDEFYAPHDGEGRKSWTPLKSATLALAHVSILVTLAFDTLAYSVVWAVPIVCIYFIGTFLAKKFL